MSIFQLIAFYLRYALRSLRREGARTILAGLSIAFGVLSLVSMQSLAGTLLSGALFDDHVQLGGDAQIIAPNWGEPFTQAELDQLETWQDEGLIARYSPTSESRNIFLQMPDNGRVNFLSGAYGIDPTVYGLTGPLVLREPAGASAAEVLREPHDALITRDIADKHNLHVGGTILISSGTGVPTRLNITGIISETPNRHGGSVYYTLDTARLIEGREQVVTNVSVLWGDVPGARQTIIDSPFNVHVAMSREEKAENNVGTGVFDLMLKGAGVLGLLVGGLGVSNTLQVMLARRKLEIAMLKTVGWQRGMLLALVGLEMGLLGLIGSLVGAAAGSALGGALVNLLGGLGTFMLDWKPEPNVLIGGILAGTLTAIIFGLQAILNASATRPIQLLQERTVQPSIQARAAQVVLLAVLVLVFGLLVGLVLGSAVQGVAYVIGGGLFLLLLRLVFIGLLWVLLKLPVPGWPLLTLAKANLGQRKSQASTILLALFAGMFSVTFAAIAINNAERVMGQARGTDDGFNMMIFTEAAQAETVLGEVIREGATDQYIRTIGSATLAGNSIELEGRTPESLAADVRITDGAWDGEAETALLPVHMQEDYALGDSIEVTAAATQTLTVTGFYEPVFDEMNMMFGGLPSGIIVAPETAQTLAGTNAPTRVLAAFPPERLNAAADTLGRALTNTLVFSKADVNLFLAELYRTLFTFAVATAGLAFVAGAVLIANAAGLTVVERRREIGVFKAVGYTSTHVLRLLIGEYAFLGLLGGVIGLIGVLVAVLVINLAQPAARMTVDPLIAGGMLAFSAAIAMGSAGLVAWSPAHVRPLEVLRYE